MKIRFTRPQMQKFTGWMGRVEFENGVSVNDVSDAEARLLAALTPVEFVEGGQAGANAEYERRKSASMPVVGERERGTTQERAGEETPTNATFAPPEKKSDEVDDLAKQVADLDDDETIVVDESAAATVAAEPAKVWTREELERVADEDGIKGLRTVGEPLGAKSTSIKGLINEILHVQANPKIEG